MSSPILMNLKNVDTAVKGIHKGIKRRSNTRTKVELEKLEAFSSLLKSQLPEELSSTIFIDFDRHLHFIGYFLKLSDYEWMESNLRDIIELDYPEIEREVYQYVETGTVPTKKRPETLSKKVFVVHGKDRKSVQELKSILKELGLIPIVLHEQPSGSRTIVEKLEKYSDVGFAFIILTPDDVGTSAIEYRKAQQKFIKELIEVLNKPKKEASKAEREEFGLNNRARQNVVLEFGFFIGLLGRDKVCCLYKGDLELPSDMHGIVYIPFGDSVTEAREVIERELKATGYEIR